jgi:hypothetical protein
MKLKLEPSYVRQGVFEAIDTTVKLHGVTFQESYDL